MSKLQWEWGERDDEITITKKKGKISFDELFHFFHEPEMVNQFDGSLIVIAFRVHSERDMYTYTDALFGAPEGDSMDIQVVMDESICPICGKNKLYPAYCPECGHKLTVPKERTPDE